MLASAAKKRLSALCDLGSRVMHVTISGWAAGLYGRRREIRIASIEKPTDFIAIEDNGLGGHVVGERQRQQEGLGQGRHVERSFSEHHQLLSRGDMILGKIKEGLANARRGG